MPEIEKKIQEIEQQMADPDFWSDKEKSTVISKELSHLKDYLDFWNNIEKEIGDLLALWEDVSGDESLKKEFSVHYKDLEKKFNQAELAVYFKEKNDKNNAIITITSGAGGTEAQDWAEMLLNMYLKYLERNNFEVELIEKMEGAEAGIKRVVVEVKGMYAHGYLRGEAGVHRLVRQSPYNAQNLRQTSFAQVEIMPEIEEAQEVEIRPDDLKIDFYRSGGPGGQNVNKVSTAVRITHIPTKLVVASQTQRSQAQNRENALKVLKFKLFQLEIEKKEKEKKELKGENISAGWGNQIRSYVLHPYKMVKDHRTEEETSDTQGVLNGEIEQFIKVFLRKNNDGKIQKIK